VAKTNLEIYLRPKLEAIGERKVRQLKASLDRQGHVDSGKLRESIKYKVIIRSSADFTIEFFWLSNNFRHNYGDALNFGADVGYLDEAGQARLQQWVGKKFNINESGAKRRRVIKRIAYNIQRKWIRKGKFPLTRKGWASIAFSSTFVASTRILVAAALTTAFNAYKDDLVRKLNRENRLRK